MTLADIHAQNIFGGAIEESHMPFQIGGDDAGGDGCKNIIHHVFHFHGLIEIAAQVGKETHIFKRQRGLRGDGCQEIQIVAGI